MKRVGRVLSRGRGVYAAAATLLSVVSAVSAQQVVRDPNAPPAAPASAAVGSIPVAAGAPPGAEAATKPKEAAATKPKEGAATRPVPAVGGLLRMTRPDVFDVNFLGTDVRLALRLLGTQSRRNIITLKGVTGTVTLDLYDVTFQEAFEAVLKSSELAYQEKGSFIYVMTTKQMDEVKAAAREMKPRVFHLAYIKAADARSLIGPALSSSGKVELTPAAAVGIGTSETDTGGDSYAAGDVLVVLDYEENLNRVKEILDALDVRPQQVLIEATILRATLDEDNALGVDFNALSGIDFQQLDSTSRGLQSVTTGDISGRTLPNNTFGSTVRTDFNSAISSGGLSIGFMTNEVALFIRALEAVTDVTVLANPKLLVVNKQRGQVMIGNRDGYLTTTVTETVATQSVQFLETGTQLVVRPFIAKDGYVRLELHPEDSSGGVGSTGLPSETTTEVTSNVLVRDGHTIIIGGLFRERTSNSRSQIPLLGDIPYLGTIFRRTIDDTVREEVIILVTPRIIKHGPDESVSEKLKDDIERFRIGQRRGLQWWGRSRMAQGHLRKAKEDLRRGRRGSALWHVDTALSLAPRMEEAIRLKERLSEKAYWSDQSQFSAVKYVIQRMIMNEMGKPVERIIPPGKPRRARDVDSDVRKAFGIGSRPEDPLPGVRRPKPDAPSGKGAQVKTRPEAADDKKRGPAAGSR